MLGPEKSPKGCGAAKVAGALGLVGTVPAFGVAPR